MKCIVNSVVVSITMGQQRFSSSQYTVLYLESNIAKYLSKLLILGGHVKHTFFYIV